MLLVALNLQFLEQRSPQTATKYTCWFHYFLFAYQITFMF